MRERTACFTGHREISSFQSFTVRRKLKKTLQELIKQGYCYFGTGGALGFDTITAQTVLNLRKKYPNIKIILVLSCVSQAARLNENDRKMYEYIKEQADKVVYTSEQYTRGCMHKRNRHLVDNSSVCICYLTQRTGGTVYTVNYALNKGLRVKNIAEK